MSQLGIEEHIFRYADDQRPEDFELLVQALAGQQLFLPADPSTFPAGSPRGVPYRAGPQDQIKIRTCRGPQQQPCLIAVTHAEHAALAEGYIGMEWQDILQLCAQTGNDTGVILQGRTSWIVFDHERVQGLLKRDRPAG